MSVPGVILGVDPGTATMGWGVVRLVDHGRVRYVQHGAIRTPPTWEMPRRLSRLFEALTEILAGYEPEAVAIEDLFNRAQDDHVARADGQRIARLLDELEKLHRRDHVPQRSIHGIVFGLLAMVWKAVGQHTF